MFLVAEDAGRWHMLEILTEQAGLYSVEVRDQKNGFSLRAPEGVPMCFKPLIPVGWIRAYFYVPEELDRLAIYNPPRNVSAILYGPEGAETELKPENGPLFVVEVPPGKAGRVWSLRRPSSSSPVRLLNAPEVFSLSPQTLVVPAEAR
jgi:hypothetical protein